MKFNFSSGITLAFGKCEPTLKLHGYRILHNYDSLCSSLMLSGSQL